jgi:hypothetical protein
MIDSKVFAGRRGHGSTCGSSRSASAARSCPGGCYGPARPGSSPGSRPPRPGLCRARAVARRRFRPAVAGRWLRRPGASPGSARHLAGCDRHGASSLHPRNPGSWHATSCTWTPCSSSACTPSSSRRSRHGNATPRSIDHVLIHGERHLRTVQAEFQSHCNHHRPYRSRPFHPPYTTQAGPIDLTAPINHWTTVSGLVNEYRRAA